VTVLKEPFTDDYDKQLAILRKHRIACGTLLKAVSGKAVAIQV